MKNLGPIDYLSPIPPEGYRCMDCDAFGVKLWRMSNSSCIEFRCLVCANIKEEEDAIPSPDKRGVIRTVDGQKRQTESIGNLVPAIPVPDGSSCWSSGYASNEACLWWWSLPFITLKRVTIHTKPGTKIFITSDNAIYEILALYESEPYPESAPGSKTMNPGHYSVDSNGDVTPLGKEEGS